jgi:hypothetical protein
VERYGVRGLRRVRDTCVLTSWGQWSAGRLDSNSVERARRLLAGAGCWETHNGIRARR